MSRGLAHEPHRDEQVQGSSMMFPRKWKKKVVLAKDLVNATPLSQEDWSRQEGLKEKLHVKLGDGNEELFFRC